MRVVTARFHNSCDRGISVLNCVLSVLNYCLEWDKLVNTHLSRTRHSLTCTYRTVVYGQCNQPRLSSPTSLPLSIKREFDSCRLVFFVAISSEPSAVQKSNITRACIIRIEYHQCSFLSGCACRYFVLTYLLSCALKLNDDDDDITKKYFMFKRCASYRLLQRLRC